MLNGLLAKLRGARWIELFAALALAALVGLLLTGLDGYDGGGKKTGLETRLEDILERVDGAGQVSAMITQSEDGGVTGVLIVAERLDSMQTYLRLQRAVATLLGVEIDKIESIGGRLGGGA